MEIPCKERGHHPRKSVKECLWLLHGTHTIIASPNILHGVMIWNDFVLKFWKSTRIACLYAAETGRKFLSKQTAPAAMPDMTVCIFYMTASWREASLRRFKQSESQGRSSIVVQDKRKGSSAKLPFLMHSHLRDFHPYLPYYTIFSPAISTFFITS